MAFEERKACLWHAFNALGEQGKGVGVKSQLKVSCRGLVVCRLTGCLSPTAL